MYVENDHIQRVISGMDGKLIYHKPNNLSEDAISILCNYNAMAFSPYGEFDDRISGGALLAREDLLKNFT